MRYYLTIDTETSGIPRSWGKKNIKPEKWPYILQVSWLIHDEERRLIKSEDHFIYEEDIHIDPKSQEIHGITFDKLLLAGEPRQQVMETLQEDLIKYQPIIIGHFVAFDINMIKVEFQRAGLEDITEQFHSFCVMGVIQVYEPRLQRYRVLRLGELYKRIFNEELQHQHNSYIDAKATSRCFFELLRTNKISPTNLEKHPPKPKRKNPIKKLYKKYLHF